MTFNVLVISYIISIYCFPPPQYLTEWYNCPPSPCPFVRYFTYKLPDAGNQHEHYFLKQVKQEIKCLYMMRKLSLLKMCGCQEGIQGKDFVLD